MGCFVEMCGKKLQPVDDEISRNEEYADEPGASSKMPSVSNKILSGFYSILHRFRIVILVIMVGAVVVSTYFAVGIKLPANSDVRMLPPRISFEQHHSWSRNLLSYGLFTNLGTPVRFIFGAKASDTGDHRDPYTLSKLALDDKFDPSSTDAQEYLKGFCERLLLNNFVSVRPNYVCPINALDIWLSDQAALDVSLQTPGYVDACKNGTDSLPMDESFFHSCFTFWFRTVGEGLYTNRDVLDRDGIVKMIRINAITSVQADNPYPVLQREWKKFEDWVEVESGMAPVGVNNFFHSASIWWWKDTNGQMIQTALGAALIAICFSAVIVFLSSRSLRLTLFSGLCILYVLSATTACLVSLGWELGFLESVCFAILIGISCDFVIHFGHAYIAFQGYRPREDRTKYAAIHMGPSILAAAATTFSAAIVMLFCTLAFFTKFAEMLLLTITHAIIGSFVLYLVLTDTFGPSEPTKLYDKVAASLCGPKEQDEHGDGLHMSVHDSAYDLSGKNAASSAQKE